MSHDLNDIILDFWRCSLRNNFSEFDFDEAFDEYEPWLHRNCIEHGQGTFEEYLDNIDGLYGLRNLEEEISNIHGLCSESDWYCFSAYDAVEAVLKAQYKVVKKTFNQEVHGDNAKLLEEIQNRRHLSEPELISLFDEAIHAQHINGDILEDCDVVALREEAESEWEEEQVEKNKYPTNIREFLDVK